MLAVAVLQIQKLGKQTMYNSINVVKFEHFK